MPQEVVGNSPTFNSTAPIDIGDEWLVFFHWKYMAIDTSTQRPHLLYHLGAYTLDKKFTKITRQMHRSIVYRRLTMTLFGGLTA